MQRVYILKKEKETYKTIRKSVEQNYIKEIIDNKELEQIMKGEIVVWIVKENHKGIVAVKQLNKQLIVDKITDNLSK